MRSEPGAPGVQRVMRRRWWTWRQQRAPNSVPNTSENTYHLSPALDTDYPGTTTDNTRWNPPRSRRTALYSLRGCGKRIVDAEVAAAANLSTKVWNKSIKVCKLFYSSVVDINHWDRPGLRCCCLHPGCPVSERPAGALWPRANSELTGSQRADMPRSKKGKRGSTKSGKYHHRPASCSVEVPAECWVLIHIFSGYFTPYGMNYYYYCYYNTVQLYLQHVVQTAMKQPCGLLLLLLVLHVWHSSWSHSLLMHVKDY